MNHLKALMMRKKCIEFAEEEKKAESGPMSGKKLRPRSSVKSINEVASGYDLKHENPPLSIYSTPRMKQNMAIKKQNVFEHLTNKAIFRSIEQETIEAEQEIMRDTITQMTQRGANFTKEELSTVYESNKKRVYKRPMTATNPHKKRKEGINIFRRDSDDDLPLPPTETPVKKSPERRNMDFDDDMIVKQKITLDDPIPTDMRNTTTGFYSSKKSKGLKIKKRPKSKIAMSRKSLTSAKAKFKVKVERNVDMKSVVLCKNNERLKLSSIACPDEKTDKIKRLERRLDYEMPLMDKGLEPGSQKSLFPSRKTEQELMIFKEIFIAPKEKELEKLKERAKVEREEYETKISMKKPKKRVLKPIKAKKYPDLDLNKLNTNHYNKKRFEELITHFKKSIEGANKREDAAGECLVEGKQGLELYLNKNYDSALSHFSNCLKMGISLKNSRLRLDCLLWIGYTIRILLENEKLDSPVPVPFGSPISGQSEPFVEITVEALETAYELSKKLNESKLSQELMCNLGIIRGNMNMPNYADQHLATLANTESLYEDFEDDEEAIEGEDEEEPKEEDEEDDLLEDLPVGEAFM